VNQIPIFRVEASLPPVCGGLLFSVVEIFQDPRLGAAIHYQSPASVRADAYLYNLGLPDIPVDLRSPDVHEWFQRAWQEILFMFENKRYLDFKPLTFQFLHVPPDAPEPFCLWAAFSYRQPPGPEIFFTGRQISHLTLRTDLGFINKVRYSYPDIEEIKEAQFRDFLAFLFEWTTAVQEFSDSAVE
jgi:hypothetical protein